MTKVSDSNNARFGESGHTFPAPPTPPADRPGQFSLAAMFLATAITAVLLGALRFAFGPQGGLAMQILAPLLMLGAVYACLRLPFVLSAVGRKREYYRALQRHRAELAAWMAERSRPNKDR